MTEALSNLHLLRPHWLGLLLPLGVLLWWLYRHRQHGGGWHGVIAPALLPYLIDSGARRRRRSLWPALGLGWLVSVVALAGPSWEKLPQPVLQKQDALVLVLDLSYSMWAQDTRPSRIDRARRKLLDLLDMRQEGQTALIAYAGDAHVVTPLTDDHPTIANLLPALDPGMMPLPGSDPAAAIAAARQLLTSAGVVRGRILLVSDGLDARDADAIRDALDNSGATLSVLGVGTAEGAPIPLPDGGFLKDGNGAIVMPKLRSETLRELAETAGGRYRSLTVDPSDLEDLLAPVADTLANDAREIDRRADAWADMAHWLALPLLPMLLFAFRRGAVYALLPLVFLFPAERSRADAWSDLWLTKDQQAARALAGGEHERAAETFVDPRWRGAAAYAAGDYDTALEGFSEDETADGWYNRGNVLARQGDLDGAISAYQESLQRDPERQDARDNLDLVQRLKREQEAQQDQQQQEDQQQGDDPQNNDAGQDSDASSSPSERQPGDNTDDAQAGADDPGGSGEQRPEDSESQRERDTGPNDGNQGPDSEGDQSAAAESREQPRANIDTGSPLAESLERDQAMQQWLRRVPDDPSGLLREKFRYESRKRQRTGENGRNDDDVW